LNVEEESVMVGEDVKWEGKGEGDFVCKFDVFGDATCWPSLSFALGRIGDDGPGLVQASSGLR
jgi:hypothetical protein